ncbi:MAG: DUF167 domain-containing protein [Candidatus Omnitrophica bacterium]|nr:DUF167 domain-containing protein [Candidatus Omnitrophota bacterium]MBU4473173.1 DUF167 domain-containing protein [Candidatus Omnitrophota bacterium]MCG2706460.1 DUF167 domain-containing protein [Candidatus Omnitrophota bacterium]
MILNIRVIPKSSRTKVQKENGGWRVYLTKPAHQGLANKQLIDLLAEYFNLKRYQIRIIKGEKSRNKIIEINAKAFSACK